MRPGFGIGQHLPATTKDIDWSAAQATVDLVSGKWTIPVVAALHGGTQRHGDLRRAIGSGVSDKVLTATLRRMEADGLLTRRAIDGNPPAVFYSLSRLGQALSAPLGAMADWQSLIADNQGESPKQQ